MTLYPRGTPHGFAQRTKKNLDYIHTAREKDPDKVHEVTQIVNSFLGLVFYPWEVQVDKKDKDKPLAYFIPDEWLEWEIKPKTPDTLGKFIKHLRNGICHGRVKIPSDDLDPTNVTITISDAPSDKHKQAKDKAEDWSVRMRASNMAEFCKKLSDIIEAPSEGN